MVRSKVAFLQSADENVLATLQLMGGLAGVSGREFTITEYSDENELLQAIVLARLDDETTIELTSRVLLSVAGIPQDAPWVSVIAGRATYASIGLRMPTNEPVLPLAESQGVLGGIDMNIALEQTPVPLCLLEGPEHHVVFINDGYAHLLGRQSREQILGLPIRALTDYEGQPFFGWLDQVYRTGKPFVGREVAAHHFCSRTQKIEEIYYDFMWQPVLDAAGKWAGFFCQAADVTERVLDKQVREDREKKLFQQWAELDAMYRTSPMGMMLLRASDLTILRLNDIQATYLGGKAEDLVGRRIEEFYPNEPFVGEVLRRVVDEKTFCTLAVTAAVPSAPGKMRKWNWNVNPILNASNTVECIASVTLEITEASSDSANAVELKNDRVKT